MQSLCAVCETIRSGGDPHDAHHRSQRGHSIVTTYSSPVISHSVDCRHNMRDLHLGRAVGCSKGNQQGVLAAFILTLIHGTKWDGKLRPYINGMADDWNAAAETVMDEIDSLREGERDYGYRHLQGIRT